MALADVMKLPKPVNWVLAVIMAVLTAAGSVAGLLKLDDRYAKTRDLDNAKVQIIEELRDEVTRNRTIMIRNMERERLDIEFLLETTEDPGERHYLESKKRAIEIALKELEGE